MQYVCQILFALVKRNAKNKRANLKNVYKLLFLRVECEFYTNKYKINKKILGKKANHYCFFLLKNVVIFNFYNTSCYSSKIILKTMLPNLSRSVNGFSI